LVDHAKSRSRAKRNPVLLDFASHNPHETPLDLDVDILALDDALENLAKQQPRLAQVIELHYFGGMTYEEIATAQGSSAATVHREIRLARAWLLDAVDGPR
jgi:RNA polymerase sigma factor (sigma-70 family)